MPSRHHADTFSPMTWKPIHFVVVAISGWMNREQDRVIEYLREEDLILGRPGRTWPPTSSTLPSWTATRVNSPPGTVGAVPADLTKSIQKVAWETRQQKKKP